MYVCVYMCMYVFVCEHICICVCMSECVLYLFGYINHQYLYIREITWQVGRVFTNGPGDLGSILSRVILKTLKMLLDTSLLNTLQYKVHIKGKVEKSRGKK